MIKTLWTDINLDNYNRWYPLTGTIMETPQQYINTWPNVNDWFTTFAIRAENDINAYLNFILYKFPFDSFKDKLIQETLRDMVYVMVEHWVFNRTPIEFNVDATIQFNNGTQFSATSIPTINVWDLAPSRMKILAQLTQLKQLLMSCDEQEIAVDKIDLGAFYTRNQVDELITNEQSQRISGDKDNHDFTLAKQIKLYDDIVSDNEHEVFRGAVTKFVNKSFIATEYDPKTETMVLNWPSEIGTLPPQALQNNPQVGDFTHAATADFSAKQQKRITSNENNINLAKQVIENIKNNYFNIETSPLWKKVENKNIELQKWYVIKWNINYSDNIGQQLANINRITKVFLQGISPTSTDSYTLDAMFYIDEYGTDRFEKGGTLFYSTTNKTFSAVGYNHGQHAPNSIFQIKEIYLFQGTGTPTEFIAEKSIEHDYYTKTETDAKFQNKIVNSNMIERLADNSLTVNIDPNRLLASGLLYSNNYSQLTTTHKSIIGGINELNNKQNKIIGDASTLTSGADGYVNEKNQIRIYDAPKEPVALRIAKFNKYDNLQTEDKTIIGGINELVEKFKNIPIWKEVGQFSEENEQIKYNFILGKTYKVWYHFGDAMDPGGMPRSYIAKEFLYNGQFSQTSSHYLDYWENKWNKKYFLEIFGDKIILHDPEKSPSVANGKFLKLQELQENK